MTYTKEATFVWPESGDPTWGDAQLPTSHQWDHRIALLCWDEVAPDHALCVVPTTSKVIVQRGALLAVQHLLDLTLSQDDLVYQIAALLHERGFIGEYRRAIATSTALKPSAIIRAKYPDFSAVADWHVARSVRVPAVSKRLHVALDLRHMPDLTVGTSVYGSVLLHSLAKRDDLSLSVIVKATRQVPAGVRLLVAPKNLPDDIDLVHKPAPCFDPHELDLLFSSRALVAITQLDLIAYHAQTLFKNPQAAETYRATAISALQAAQGVIAISKVAQNEIAHEAHLPTSDIYVTMMGVDPSALQHAPLPREARKQQLLCVSTDFPHKNLDALIAAFAILRRTRPDLELVLVGARPWAGKPVQVLGVHSLGSVSDATLHTLYSESIATIFPSLYEGFGIPVLESMARGTPVVLFRGSAQEEVAGAAGIYATDLSSDALARACERALTDNVEWERSAALGRALAQELTWERCVEQTIGAYRKVAAEPSSRSIRARQQLAPLLVASRPGIKEATTALKNALKRRVNKQLHRP